MERGFSLIELLVTISILGVVMLALMGALYSTEHSKTATTNRIESSRAALTAMDMLVQDLRVAGYGTDVDWVAAPQPPLAYIDSLQVLIQANLDPYPDIGAAKGSPLAYNPTGNPRPFPIDGTAWQPPMRYRSGAEIIRWTLDVNNDGQISSADVQAADGADARRTPNPNDYTLVRQVFGDSTGLVAGDNGGVSDRIALIRKPASNGIPPMFQVYLKGSATPWNWSSGPVPANRLGDVERIEIDIEATASRPDWLRRYLDTRLHGSVGSLRNAPNPPVQRYTVDGTVFLDSNKNGVKDLLEVGIAAVVMKLGNGLMTTTNLSGHYEIKAPAGNYILTQQPPWGYGVLTSPSSFNITLGPSTTRNFADTLAIGGFVDAFAFEDKNSNAVKDLTEPALVGIQVTMSPTGQTASTDLTGHARLFAPSGAYSVTVTQPDSFACTTGNPVGGTMSNLGAASLSFGLAKTARGNIVGSVFRDDNRNAAKDGGESGIANVWVGVTPDNGVTVLGFANTDASGNFSISVPANDPPRTRPYNVFAVVPSGFYPTTNLSQGPIYVTGSGTSSGWNIGFSGFQSVTLQASRVLSLGSGDVIENDWNGNQTENARRDVDLILGADTGGSDNVSVWFNRYDDNTLFSTSADYARAAPEAVLALALDSLDTASPKARLDVITGTRNAGAGNFFVWFNQNSSSNEGYFANSYSTAYRTSDNGDVQTVVTADLAGGAGADGTDILVGTKSPTAWQGTIELWQSNNAATPAYSRVNTYPTAGSIPGNSLGEVTCMALGDVTSPADGIPDLVVGTRTSATTGQLMILKGNGKILGSSRFTHTVTYTLADGAVTSLRIVDMNADGKKDVVIGRQTGSSSGDIEYWRNSGILSTALTMDTKVNAPGIVLSITSGELGANPSKPDIAIGWRHSDSDYAGGALIYYNDLVTLPSTGSDPTGGGVTSMVPTMTINDFNYGVKPALPPSPYLKDLALGVRSSSSTGALVVLTR